jgi:hypothetical protein
MGTMIKEVAFLDLTEASEETLAQITAIKKVAFMIYNEKFEPFMSKIDFHEIASSVKVPGPFSLINGKLTMDKGFLNSVSEPMFYLINGKMTIKPDVTPELIDQAISGLYLNGKIYCPEHVQGMLHQKIRQQNGKIVTYMAQATHLEPNKLTLTNTYLKSLDLETNLVVAGQFRMDTHLDKQLFNEKIKHIQFLNGALIPEAFAETLYEKLVEGAGTLTFIPEGYTYFEGNLHLDSDVIERYNTAKLYISGAAFFDETVSDSLVRQHLSAIIAEEGIYARAELKRALLDLCDPSVKLTTYSGVLRIVDGEHTLTQPELDYTEGKITYIIQGVLQIDKGVEPKALLEKIERVDLYGVISGGMEQCGVLQTKLRIKEGVIDSEDEPKGTEADQNGDQEEPGTHVIAKVSQLKL